MNTLTIISITKFFRTFSLSLLVFLTSLSSAQVPVYDINGTRNPQQSQQVQAQQSASPVTGANNNDVMVNMYLQLEQLQQEVQSLRGIVEEQTYQIRQMQTEQRDRYLDLDRRVSEMTGANGELMQPGSVNSGFDAANGIDANVPFVEPPALQTELNSNPPDRSQMGSNGVQSSTFPDSGINTGVSAAATSAATTTGAVAVASSTSVTAPNAENEQEIYRSALNLLLEQSRYDEAIAGFGRYIDAYPSGRYLANAYYWQGEALILAQRYTQAESVFRKVLDDFPADPKAADAMLKLGVVYSQTGNIDRARETWQGIRSSYPESLAAIRAAEDYLSRL